MVSYCNVIVSPCTVRTGFDAVALKPSEGQPVAYPICWGHNSRMVHFGTYKHLFKVIVCVSFLSLMKWY